MRPPDFETLSQLAGWHPEHGVVSVYLGIDPADRREGWRVELRDRLKELVDAAEREGPRERWQAMQPTVERVLQSFPPEGEHPSGRCQIAFAEVSEDASREVRYSTQLAPRRTLILRDSGPYLRPLLELLDDGAARGVIAVSGERVRAFHWLLGQTEEVRHWEFSETTEASDRMKDQAAQHLEEQHARFLRSVGSEIASRFSRRGWSETLCFGAANHYRALADGAAPEVEVRHAGDHDIVHEGAHEVGERIDQMLDDLNRSRELALVERAKNAVYAEGGRGSLGVRETLEALAQGRVEHLLFDAERDYDEADLASELALDLSAGGDRAGDAGRAEGRLAERMVEQAIQTSARVTPLEGEAAAALEEHEGVAAILRY